MATDKEHGGTSGEDGDLSEARKRTLAAREQAVGERERASGAGERAVGEREASMLTREDVMRLREDVVLAREATAEALSQHNRLIRDLKEANQALMLSSIRSQELAEVAEEARRALERSDRELREVATFRDRLIGIVSHDLRAPLSAISVAAELLAERHLSGPESRRMADRIRRSTRRMARMIEQLLDFTRAHVGGGLPLELKPTDLGEVARRIVDELELGQSSSGRFACDFQGDLRGTWDPDRLAQVLSNLGSNAMAHGAADAPIELRLRDEGATILVEMKNRGQPIPPDLLPFIFDPYRRVRQEDKTGGLGLGLYISHQIVVAHGGEMTVRSGASDGTTFSIRLPRHAPPGRRARSEG